MSVTSTDLRIGVTHQLRNVWRASRLFVVIAVTITIARPNVPSG